MTGHQLARVSAIKYHETLWSGLFPGNRHTVRCLQPAVLATESSLELSPRQQQRTVWRLDGGGGSDDNLCWLLARPYQIVAKGKSNRRACALARQVQRWDPVGDAWIANVEPPINFGRPPHVFVKRRVHAGQFRYSYYVTTLKLPSKKLFMLSYDQRGGAEVEQFRNDKSGLSLAARRKRSFAAQRALVLLTDIAHNLLADFHAEALVDTRFHGYGLKRIVRDLLHIPGQLVFTGEKLTRIDLCKSNEYSRDLIICLEKYCLRD